MIKDSGTRTEFETGAVRDCKDENGRCDLMPLDAVGDVLQSEVILCIARYKGNGNPMLLQASIVNFCEDEGTNIHNAMLDLSKHFADGAKKYGENNWKKGIPIHSYIDSAVRHYLKYKAGWKDEPHDRAFMWNLVCCMWTVQHHPELDDWTEKRTE